MSIRLSDLVQQTHGTSPGRMLLHATEKVGKSTMFAGGTVHLPGGSVKLEGAPDPIFLPTEDGLRGLSTNAFPLSQTYKQFVKYLMLLTHESHDYKTVVIDSADWLEKLIHEDVIASCPDGKKSMESAHGGYGKAYQVAMGNWRHVLSGLDYLNKNIGMFVGIICHSQVVKFDDPNSEPYDRYELKLHQPRKGTGAKDLLMEWADIIAFADAPTMIREKKTADGKKIVRGQLLRGQLNRMHLQGGAAFVAGNRYGLPDTIELSWSAFDSAMNEATGHHAHPSLDTTPQPTKNTNTEA